MYTPDEYDEYDPDDRPEPQPSQQGYDEYIYDEDEEAREQMVLEHEIREAMEEEHEREVAEGLGKTESK